MVAREYEKLMFFLFDNELYQNVLDIYNKWDYIRQNDNTEFIRIISECKVSNNSEDIINLINSIDKLKETDNFVKKDLIKNALALQMFNENKISLKEFKEVSNENIIEILKKDKVNFYFSPGIQRIDNQQEDKNKSLIWNLNRNIDFKDYFKKNVENLDEPYRSNEKIKFSLKHDEFEYGISACNKLIEIFENSEVQITPENYKKELSVYSLIIDFMKHFQQYQYKFLDTDLYRKSLKIFKDTPLEISLITLSILEENKNIALKKLQTTITRLKSMYSNEEIDSYSQYFLLTLNNIKG
jgi:hypothetical protein